MADDEDLLVTISGPALSMLLYENARSPEQIGFLLGEVLVYVTKHVTDSDKDVENVKQYINVQSVVAYPTCEPFFNSVGHICKNKLNNFLKENVKKVVGWYHYRQDFRLAMAYRDIVLHIELSSFFSDINELILEDNFICCLLNSTVSNTGATHKFKQLLRRRKGSIFKPVTLKINNLGADASRPDGSDYKPAPQITSCESDAFDKVYDHIRNDLKHTSGVHSVTLIQKTAEKLLQDIIPQVTKTDRIVSELEGRLITLRDEWFQRDCAKASLIKQMSQMEVDPKPDDQDEVKSTSSSDIYDSPSKTQSSSGTKILTRRNIKQEESSSSEQIAHTSEKESTVLSRRIPRQSEFIDTLAPRPTSFGRGTSFRQSTYRHEAGGGDS